MGRFETTVEFYRYREPYPPIFFETVAARVPLTLETRLLDVGCGPGYLAIGFAPFVGSTLAIDREPAMLEAARAAATEVKREIAFLQTGIEDLDFGESAFDFVTIGRALHWLTPEATLRVLERVVSPEGRIGICGSAATDAAVNEWSVKFREVRRAWASDPAEAERHKVDSELWFSPSLFRKVDEIAVEYRHRVSVAELIGRALSFSTNSPAVLGERRAQYEADIRAAVEPFAKDGTVEEVLRVKATVFGRRLG